MDFIALKPCCFAGQKFKIGETVPGELILPEMQKRLLAMGKLATLPEENPKSSEVLKPSEKSQKNKKRVSENGDMDV